MRLFESRKAEKDSEPYPRTCGSDKGGYHHCRLVGSCQSLSLMYTHSRLDLTAPTRHMGQRKLLKEGLLMKAKSGRKLRGFLCSDILVLTEETAKSLYRMVCFLLSPRRLSRLDHTL